MKLIVGLGNPGERYTENRHNVGYRLVDRLSESWSIALNRRKFQGLLGDGWYGGEQVMLLKPETYMNCSGDSVTAAIRFYQLDERNVLVVVDDMALALGHLRLRAQGSSGGHNGLKDIFGKLGHDAIARLRVGIGAGVTRDAIGHVLGDFGEQEKPIIERALEQAAGVVECWLMEGIEEAMTRYNVRGKNLSNDDPQDEAKSRKTEKDD